MTTIKSDTSYPTLISDLVEERALAIELQGVLLRNGFTPCDIPACNCGSWHHRYGLPQRLAEIKDSLADAGHPLENKNGNLHINALNELVSDRDALKARVAELEQWREGAINFYPKLEAMEMASTDLNKARSEGCDD